MKKKSLDRIGLYITPPELSREFIHIRLYPVLIGLDRYERECIDRGEDHGRSTHATIRNCRDHSTNGLYLQDLFITSQGHQSRDERKFYGFAVEYRNVHIVNARDARAMASTLTTIEKRMQKLEEKFGHPASFGAYCARVAEAIGASEFVRLSPHSPKTGMYNTEEHDHMEIKQGIWTIDRMVHDWLKPQTETETV